MSNIDIILAWKDEDYCNSLSEEQRSQLPDNPAGIIELSDEDMEIVAGGYGTWFKCGGRKTIVNSQNAAICQLSNDCGGVNINF